MVKAAASSLPAPLPFKVHPVAEIFPLMEGAAFLAFVEDIRKHGQRDPIMMFGDILLDGRNRRRVCDIIGSKPYTVEWPGGDPVQFIISRNLHRRHLTPSQRAMTAARLANMKREDTTFKSLHPSEVLKNTSDDRNEKISAQEAADLFHVSRPHVFHARTVINHGTPEEINLCDAGEAGVSTTANAIRKRKIADGSWEVKPRGRHIGEAVTAEIVQLHPGKSNRKMGPILPGDVTPQAMARQAITLRDTGRSVAAVARQLNIATMACRQMIDIVLIADRTDLSVRETQIAATALDRMDNRSMPLSAIYGSITDIAHRLWGGATQGSSRNRKGREEARFARFDRGIGVLLQACTNGAVMEVPHLSSERVREMQADLRQAIVDVKILLNKIGSIHA